MLKRAALGFMGLGLTYAVEEGFSGGARLQLPDTTATVCMQAIHDAALACAADPVTFNTTSDSTHPAAELRACLKAHEVDSFLLNCSRPDPYRDAHLYVGGRVEHLLLASIDR